MNTQENWDDLRYFLAVARFGSLSAAARQLRVNHTTVLRRVAALEAALGVTLFERLPVGYVLTAAGDEMLRAASKVEEDIEAINRQLSGLDPRTGGTVRVTTLDILAYHLLPPYLAAFQRQHKSIRIDLLVAEASLSLSKREADVAIRATSTPPEHLIGRRVAGMAFAVYGAPGFMAAHGINGTAALTDLAEMSWAGLDDSFDHTIMNRWLYEVAAPDRVVWRTNAMAALAAAATAGVGLALLPCVLADRMAGLRRAGPVLENPDNGLWLLTHADLRQQYRVRVFLDAMAAVFAAERDLLEGRSPAAWQSLPPDTFTAF